MLIQNTSDNFSVYNFSINTIDTFHALHTESIEEECHWKNRCIAAEPTKLQHHIFGEHLEQCKMFQLNSLKHIHVAQFSQTHNKVFKIRFNK